MKLKKTIKILIITEIVLVLILLVSIQIDIKSYPMTGYETGTSVIKITLENSNENNEIEVCKVPRIEYLQRLYDIGKYTKEELEEQIEKQRKANLCEVTSISNNEYTYLQQVNLYEENIFEIQISRNDGSKDILNVEIDEYMGNNNIPTIISYDCKKGEFKNNTDYNSINQKKELKIKVDQIFENMKLILFIVSIILLIIIIVLSIIILRKRKEEK